MPLNDPGGYGPDGTKPITKQGNTPEGMKPATQKEPTEGQTNPATRPAVDNLWPHPVNWSDENLYNRPKMGPPPGGGSPMGTWPINKDGKRPSDGWND